MEEKITYDKKIVYAKALFVKQYALYLQCLIISIREEDDLQIKRKNTVKPSLSEFKCL